MTLIMYEESKKIAVLISGGLDSLVLLDLALKKKAQVYPMYIRKGLFWEQAELKSVAHALNYFSERKNLHDLKILFSPFDDIDEEHWAYTGQNIPSAESPDEAVEIPLRNLQFLIKTSQFCLKEKIPEIYLGTLGSNPFNDAKDDFFEKFSELIFSLSRFKITILRPFSQMSKAELIRAAGYLPLHTSFSCLQPQGELHCGRCNKCAERKLAFSLAKIEDKTLYYQAA